MTRLATLVLLVSATALSTYSLVGVREDAPVRVKPGVGLAPSAVGRVDGIPPRPTATPRTSRSRTLTPSPERSRGTSGVTGTAPDWSALARCESSGNPKAINRTGKYRGAFQMDANFWRTYGGLRFASRPDLATYEQQVVVAQNGYNARGRSPWPYCGRFL